MRPVLTLVVLLLLTFSSSVHALVFRVLSWEGGITEIYYQDGKETLEIRGFDDRFSRNYKYEKSGNLEFFKLVQTDEGEKRDILLSIPLPADANRLLLILHVSPDGKRILQHRVIDDSFETTPLGNIHFHNFSSYAVMLEFENDAGNLVSLHKGAKHLFQVSPDIRSVPLRAATAEVEGQWQLFSTLPLPARSTLRTLVIFRDSRTRDAREAGAVEMTVFQDPLRPPRAENSK